MKRKRWVILLSILVLLAVLIPAAAQAYTICNTYSDGCTICDFYNSQHKWVGYAEWCS
jgi:hypothetical protein